MFKVWISTIILLSLPAWAEYTCLDSVVTKYHEYDSDYDEDEWQVKYKFETVGVSCKLLKNDGDWPLFDCTKGFKEKEVDMVLNEAINRRFKQYCWRNDGQQY